MQIYPGYICEFKYTNYAIAFSDSKKPCDPVSVFVYSYKFDFVDRAYTLFFETDEGKQMQIEIKMSDLKYIRFSPVMMKRKSMDEMIKRKSIDDKLPIGANVEKKQ